MLFELLNHTINIRESEFENGLKTIWWNGDYDFGNVSLIKWKLDHLIK